MEKLLRKAFNAGYKFTILKTEGGKGIDFDKWYNSEDIQKIVKLLAIPDVSNIVIAFFKWRKGEQLTHETILEVETFAKEYKSNL